MKKKTLKYLIYGLLLVIIILSFIFLVSYNQKQELSNEIILYKTIIYADSQVSEVYVIEQRAESYYSEASYFYDYGDYKLVESNCRIARGYYAEANEGYLNIQFYLESLEIEDELIKIYIESMGVLAEIKWNMYEACEYFESAARQYNIYFNTDVLVEDSSFDMGESNIETMGEKINLHDENVRKYNDILNKFKSKLNRRLNNDY